MPGFGDFLSGLFANTQETQSTQSGQQSGTGMSQSNLWPQLSPFFAQYTGTAFNPAAPNQYQTTAADSQMGAGANLAPGFNAASGIATTGIDPGRIAAFQSPYQNAVIDRTLARSDDNDAVQRAQLAAQFAKNPGSSSFRGAAVQQRGDQADARAGLEATLRDRGFNTAAGLAGQSAGLQLQGAGATGALTGALTGANQAGFGMGTTLGMQPLEWMTRGAAGLSPFLQGAGQNTAYSGQSTGSSTGTTTGTQGLGTIGSGLMGAYLMGRAKGGRVGKADGGPVGFAPPSSFAEKVADAFRVIEGMRCGGKVEKAPGYDWGGTVQPFVDLGGPASEDPYWDAKVAEAGANEARGFANPTAGVGKGLVGAANSMGKLDNPNAIAEQQRGLTEFMGRMPRPQGFDDGGTVRWEPGDDGPRFADGPVSPMFLGLPRGEEREVPTAGMDEPPVATVAPRPTVGAPYAPPAASFEPTAARDLPPPLPSEGGSWWSKAAKAVLPDYSTGIWAGKEATPSQRLGMALTQVGDASGRGGPFSGMGKAGMDMAQEHIRKAKLELERQEAERAAAALMGRFRGEPTMAARQMDQAGAQHAATLAETKRMHDASIAQTGVSTDKSTEELRRLKDPNIVYAQRAAAAEQYGLVKGSREYNEFVMTGDFPRLTTQKDSLEVQAAARKIEAERLGMKPDHPAYQSYILTGKLPREDQQPLTATDKKFIEEADDVVQANKDALIALSEGKELSKHANSGWFASSRAAIARNLPDMAVPDQVSSPSSSSATAQYENVVIGQALAALKSTFGAAPTEGERKILMELQASVGLPHDDRVKILDRAMALAERRMDYNQQKAAQLRNKDYYKPDRGNTTKLAKPIPEMSLEDLKKLSPQSLTEAQKKEAADRWDALKKKVPADAGYAP